MSSSNPSPLRYPGGKYKIVSLIKWIIEKAKIDNCIYIEPFAGGAGVALSLLMSETVSEVVINDYDKAIASFWKAILTDKTRFINLIRQTPLTIEEWQRQRNIYRSSTHYSLEYGFATFFLNRTNHSGILSSGPIGGLTQDADWTLDVRFNKEDLIERIERIAAKKRCIHCYNKDILSFIRSYLPQYAKNGFVYFDPPYYNKGKKLYKNFFAPEDHLDIAQHILNDVAAEWIVSYDAVPQIEKIYQRQVLRKFSLNYSLANNGQGTEIMIFKDSRLCPSAEDLEQAKIKISMWE